MTDIQELELRLKKMEERFKENYLLIEKRFAEIDKKLEEGRTQVAPSERTAALGEEESVIIEGSEKISNLGDMRERIQELEDLLLLIEVENTKLRESITAGRTEITPTFPGIEGRMTRLEDQVSSAQREGVPKDMEEKIRDVEKKLESVRGEAQSKTAGKNIDEIMEKYERKISELQERIEKIEKAPKVVTRLEKVTTRGKPREEEEKSSILKEVQMILKK